jgi:predicted AAA+ superfamily ATPase
MFPVLGLLGARQVGKSTFLMHQWATEDKAEYVTFDEKEVIVRAQQAPAQFLLDETNQLTQPLIIDEAHKAPDIFDSIKVMVDKNRLMDMFTLSGSVEFSSRSGVRESLAGRMGLHRLYPMTLRELNNESFNSPWVDFKFSKQSLLPAKLIETWLERGGMPIFCSISDSEERSILINSWLEAICYRDLQQFKDGIYDSELAFHLMEYLALHQTPLSLAELSSFFGTTVASIKKHLSALESLFIVYQLPSFENPRAKSKYMIFDSGVFNALGRTPSILFTRQQNLLILIINEIYAQYEYAGKLKPRLYYYKTRAGSKVDLILETKEHLIAIECVTSVELHEYAQRGMKAFLGKHPNAVGYFIAPVQKAYSIASNIHVIPWSQIG